jgi:DNA polymerase III psi subunit
MEELKILQKIRRMTKNGNMRLKQFPKHERYLLAAEIRQSMYKIIRLVIMANKTKASKRPMQDDIDVELDVLRTFIDIAVDKDMKYISLASHEEWSKEVSEIGRMLNGWKKSTK